MKRLTTFACLAVALMFAVGAFASERNIASQPTMWFGGTAAKAVGDTIDLMGPGTGFPYRGDFENGAARPGGAGTFVNGWYSVDDTAPVNHWHVDDFVGMDPAFFAISGTRSAWAGDRGFASCAVGDPAGGYGDDFRDILEFRKTVSAAGHAVRVQGNVRFDSEPGYDYLYLQRRTASQPNFEPITGSGMSWDGVGSAIVDYTFNYTAADLLNGNEIAVAFIFDADGAYSDADCLYPSAGGAFADDLMVTIDGTTVYTEDFEDNNLGPDWSPTPNLGCGDFARIWGLLGDADDCASNYSKLIAFIDDGLVVPGTGGTIGGPGNDYGPPGGYIVNNTGGLLGPTSHMGNSVYSPIMTWPDPAKGGMSFAFDVYRHELLFPADAPGILYTWGIRTAAAGNDINVAGWQDRNFVYYGGPNYLRSINVVDDLVELNPVVAQVTLGVTEMGYVFGLGDGTNGTPAPYFDNARVKVYPTAGARIAVTEIYVANDGFPAIGDIDLVNLGNNSIRFDMARNISLATHSRNDPGDSIWVDIAPRMGGTLSRPEMHWTFAKQNPLFDPYRTLPASPVLADSVFTVTGTGRVLVVNRWSFDLPDTGMIFPGDVLHYYFAATDNVAGNLATSYAPFDRSGFGNPEPMRFPGLYTVCGLPTVEDVAGSQPTTLFWNDFGFRGGEDEWYGALRSLGLTRGVDYDVYTTHGPSSGVGNGLGGRAVVGQIDGYTDMLYSCGDIGALAKTSFTGDPSNDLGLMNDWFALGGRDLFMTGDDLINSLMGNSATGQTFVTNRLGVVYGDNDIRDNIAGQTAALVVKTAANPVFTTANSWIAYGGCFGINDFDNVTAAAGAVRLAQFTGTDHVSTPYSYSAATLLLSAGGNRAISMNHDLLFVLDNGVKAPAPLAARAVLLSNVLDYFGVSNNPGNTVDVPASRAFAVESYPNPFNPQLTVKYTLKNPGNVVMKVYNIRGELVKTLLNGSVSEATGSVVWNGDNDQGGSVSSGVYFVETRSGGDVNVQKATMVK